jgi:hypothetical protein
MENFMPEEIKITHVVFNERDIKFTASFVNELDVNIGKVGLTYFSTKAIEPYVRSDTLYDEMTMTEVFILEAKLSNILGQVLKKLA